MASPFLYWIGSFIRYLKTGIQIYDNKNLLLWSKQKMLRNIFILIYLQVTQILVCKSHWFNPYPANVENTVSS